MKKNLTLLATILAAGIASAGNASAQISAGNLAANSFSTDGAGAFSINNYNVANANDVLVVGLYVDNGNSAISSLTYNGITSDGGFSGNSGNGARLSVYYFLNPSVGTFNFSGIAAQTNQGNNGYIVWELSGVNKAITPVTSSPLPSFNGSTTITTTAANSFILDFLGVNGAGYPSVPDGDSVLTKTAEVDMNGGFGGGYIASGSATEAVAGLYSLGWSINSGGTNAGEVALGFTALTAVPEPHEYAIAITALLGVAIFIRRRAQA